MSATTYHTLAQNLPNQVHDRVLSNEGTGILHKQLAQEHLELVRRRIYGRALHRSYLFDDVVALMHRFFAREEVVLNFDICCTHLVWASPAENCASSNTQRSAAAAARHATAGQGQQKNVTHLDVMATGRPAPRCTGYCLSVRILSEPFSCKVRKHKREGAKSGVGRRELMDRGSAMKGRDERSRDRNLFNPCFAKSCTPCEVSSHKSFLFFFYFPKEQCQEAHLRAQRQHVYAAHCKGGLEYAIAGTSSSDAHSRMLCCW